MGVRESLELLNGLDRSPQMLTSAHRVESLVDMRFDLSRYAVRDRAALHWDGRDPRAP